MSTPNLPAKAPLDSDCPDADSGATVLVLDAPAAKADQPPPSSSSLPKNFRTMTDDWHRTGSGTPPSRDGLSTLNASGSAQYCKGQLQAMLSAKHVSLPMTIVDLRQESHGFLQIDPPLLGESTIAVGWFVERDWMSIGKSVISVEADENRRLQLASSMPMVTVHEIKSVTSEDGICTSDPHPVNTVGWATERQIAKKASIDYIRFPTTDHVRPRDEEVDRFVAFEEIINIRLGEGSVRHGPAAYRKRYYFVTDFCERMRP